MSEAAVALGVFALGLLLLLPTRGTTGIHFVCTGAYPLGLLSWVGCSGLGLALGQAGTAGLWLLACVGGLGAFSTVRSLRSSKLQRHESSALVAWSTAFAAVACASSWWNLAVLTVDSFYYVGVGRRSFSFGGGPLAELTNYGVFVPVVQGASLSFGLDYLHSVPPLLAACGMAWFVVASQRGLAALAPPAPRARVAAGGIALLAVAAMATPHFLLGQVFVIHTNYSAAIYLLFFCTTFWLAELEQEPGWLPFSFAFLLAFSLHRLELPVIGALFALLACTQSTLPVRRMLLPLFVWSLVLALWYAKLAGSSSPETRLLKPDRALATLLLVAAVPPAVVVLRSTLAAGLRPWLPRLALCAVVGALLVALAVDPALMLRSSRAMLRHFLDPAWGLVWPAFAVFAIAAVRAPAIPLQSLFRYGGGCTLLLVLLAGVLRAGYHDGLTDSGNRMLVHLVPLLFFYFVVSLGRASLGAWSPPPRGA